MSAAKSVRDRSEGVRNADHPGRLLRIQDRARIEDLDRQPPHLVVPDAGLEQDGP
jgi:hypothetical protein